MRSRLVFLLLAAAAIAAAYRSRDALAATFELASVASDGALANAGSDAPALSADARFVAFESLASNLVAGDTNGAPDVFVHDRVTGLTTRESIGINGQANAGSHSASLYSSVYVAS